MNKKNSPWPLPAVCYNPINDSSAVCTKLPDVFSAPGAAGRINPLSLGCQWAILNVVMGAPGWRCHHYGGRSSLAPKPLQSDHPIFRQTTHAGISITDAGRWKRLTYMSATIPDVPDVFIPFHSLTLPRSVTAPAPSQSVSPSSWNNLTRHRHGTAASLLRPQQQRQRQSGFCRLSAGNVIGRRQMLMGCVSDQ